MKKIRTFLELIINRGTSPLNSPWTNQGIRLINKVSIFVSALTVPYIFLTYHLELYLASFIDTTAVILYMTIYFINAFGNFSVSRGLLVLLGNVQIFTIAIVLGKDSGIHHYFYASVIAPLFFYQPEEYRKIILACFLSIVLGVCYPFAAEYFHPYHSSSEMIKFYFHIPTISGSFIAVLSFIFYFYNESFRTQKILDDTNKQLQFIGETDHLTQIGNRRKFEAFLRMEWSRGLRRKYFISIILIDVDSFKLYNDLYGHLAGDECLKKIAYTLSNEIRTDLDFIARFGGEEFIVILHDTSLEGAKLSASKMQAAIYDLNISHSKNMDYGRVTISIGIACCLPNNSHSPLHVIEQADQSLYIAKTTGKNKYIARKIN